VNFFQHVDVADNWLRELRTWCPALEVLLYYGSQEERLGIRTDLLDGKMDKFQILLTTSVNFVYYIGWVKKSKLLILSEYVKKTEKIVGHEQIRSATERIKHCLIFSREIFHFTIVIIKISSSLLILPILRFDNTTRLYVNMMS